MKYLTGISQGFGKDKKAEQLCRTPPMTASSLKHDRNIILRKTAESLKLF